jgi:hypothetical protein
MTDAPAISLIMPYYRNPGMLAAQFAKWNAYLATGLRGVEIVIIDDGSPEPAADVYVPEPVRPHLSIYRIKIDRPWNQHGARNLGAHVSRGRILMLTDMDHMVPVRTIGWIAGIDDARAYMFPRRDAPDLRVTVGKDGHTPKPHPNTFAMTRKTWDKVGGYDEDFCGFYGTDSMFRRRLESRAGIAMAPDDCYVVRYPREVIPDASTTTLDRDAYRRPNERAAVRARKAREGRANVPLVLNFEWERVV